MYHKKVYYNTKNRYSKTKDKWEKCYSDSTSFNFEIYDLEVELILKSLELLNFNINNCWIRNVDQEQMKLRSDIIFYLYNRLLDVYGREYDADTRIKISKKFNFDIA